MSSRRAEVFAFVESRGRDMVWVNTMRFDWFARDMARQILRIQIPNGHPFDNLFDNAFVKHTNSSKLISVDTVHSGMLTELTYSIGLKKK
jgi:hypothetical protein